MIKEVKDKWVAALRSGDYQQTKEFLQDSDGFCCLGVLCDLYINEHDSPSSERYQRWKKLCEFQDGTLLDLHDNLLLPRAVREWSGVNSSDGNLRNGTCLTALNDEGMPFSEIADTIEDKWEAL